MTGPSVTVARAFWLLLLIGVFFAVSVVAYFVMMPAPTEKPGASPPLVPRIDKTNYEVLISQEKNAAAEATRLAQVQYDASVKRRIAAHASETANIADQSANRAAEFEPLSKTIYYLASDKVFDKTETDQYLQEHLGPIVEPGLQSLAKDVNADIAAFDHEVRRITVQLATNIAAIGPGVQPAPPRVVPSPMIAPKFSRIVARMGGKYADIGKGIGVDVLNKAIPRSMIADLANMCARIAFRLFGKQVAKVVVALGVPSLGPPGWILDIALVIWTGYDVNQERAKYRDEVRQAIKKQLDDADHQIASRAVIYFSGRTADFLALQTSIATRALEDIQKREPK